MIILINGHAQFACPWMLNERLVLLMERFLNLILNVWRIIGVLSTPWLFHGFSIQFLLLFGQLSPLMRMHMNYGSISKEILVFLTARICQLKYQINECKQPLVESLVSYYGRLSRLWDEVAKQELPPNYAMGGSGCLVTRFLEQLQDHDHLHCFLIDIDDAYGPIHSSLLAQDPLTTMTRAYRYVA